MIGCRDINSSTLESTLELIMIEITLVPKLMVKIEGAILLLPEPIQIIMVPKSIVTKVMIEELIVAKSIVAKVINGI